MLRWLASFRAEKRSFDFPLAIIAGMLIVAGLFVFFSASLQSLGQSVFNRMMITQLVFCFVFGGGAMYFFSHYSYKNLSQWSTIAMIISLALCVLVFLPGIGMAHGGGQRWLNFRLFNIQPSEFLKFSSVIFLSAWFAKMKKRVSDWRVGLLPYLLVTGLATALMFLQRDMGTLSVILGSTFAIFVLSDVPRRHIGQAALIGLVFAAMAFAFFPHVRARLNTYFDYKDPQGAGWQVHQGLIAIGSGGLKGKGYLQSVQRFSYLPEAIGDSIYAVVGEELGFVGSAIFVVLYVAFALRALKVTMRAPDDFSAYLAIGFLSMIVVQSFVNMGSVLGIIPFTGVPLVFVSQGGTSLVVAMAAVGVLLNISRYQKNV